MSCTVSSASSPRRAGPRARLAASAALALLLGGADAARAETPAEEQRVSLVDQTGVAVTIYNQDLALVKDSRNVPLKAGANRLAFIDVSALIRPETALLTADGGELSVVEQNFDFDLLTPEKLLEKSVGSRIRIIRTNPETGVDTVEEGLVLSVANGLVVQIGDRIETQPPGRIVFDSVPQNLRARPTLVLDVASTVAGTVPVRLSYLTGGLSWRADYVAELTPDESTLDLSGWVTLTNASGTAYRDAKLQLVAGDVNQVPKVMMQRMEMAADGAVATAAPPMREEALFEYHLYSLERPTTLAENQTKQVALLSGAGIPVAKEYRFYNITNAYNYQMGEQERVNATVRLAFDNTEAAKLGIPLPAGTVRVYKADTQGQVLFVGEDAIQHTPKNETVRLALGQAFDVTARAKQTEYDQLSNSVFETAFSVEIKNAKPTPVTVNVVENLPGDWKILQESHPHEKQDAGTVVWSVPVPAEGSTTLTYRVRVKF